MNERTITPLNDGDNPPAFPNHPRVQLGDAYQGISLRDYFAAKALEANADNHLDEGGHIAVARDCYAYADAMLRARKENGQ